MIYDIETHNSIAFGSCNRQNLNQSFWNVISSFNPSVFLWTGDSVYAPDNSLQGLLKTYNLFSSNKQYSNFKNRVIVDGIWDDHDYGVNDAGRWITNRAGRQAAFLDFLGTRSDALREQDGLYHYKDFIVKRTENIRIRVIFLDVRSHRDSHLVRSVGEFHFPYSAVAAAALRTIYTLLGFGKAYEGDMLGSAQWVWLEKTLRESQAHAHVLVSSVQVLTTNPVVESWGHFPRAKRRLMALLAAVDPPGLVFISGDVHHAELSSISVKSAIESQLERRWTEVTSSGLTHTCADSRMTGFLCPLMLRTFRRHRHNPEAFAITRNFGIINVTEVSQPTMSRRSVYLNVSVHDVTTGMALLEHSELLDTNPKGKPVPITDVEVIHFYSFSPTISNLLMLFLLSSIVLTMYFLSKLFRKEKAFSKRL